jgi:hypothetical protein
MATFIRSSSISSYYKSTHSPVLFQKKLKDSSSIDSLTKDMGQLFLQQKENKDHKDDGVHTSTSSSSTSRVVKVLQNVHADDILALILLDDSTFVSGSKDGSLKKWQVDGNSKPNILLRKVQRDSGPDYRQWITAITRINENLWMHGSRYGNVNLWKTNGEWVKKIRVAPPRGSYKCKSRNNKRVNCLAPSHLSGKQPRFFCGSSDLFQCL